MTEQKHTPGPWEWTIAESYFRGERVGIRAKSAREGDWLLELEYVDTGTPYSPWRDAFIKVAPADARLIAAAPELLGFVEMVRGAARDALEDSEIEDWVEATIERADEILARITTPTPTHD